MNIDDMYGRQLTKEELYKFMLDIGKRNRERMKEEVRKFYPKTYKAITKWSENK